MARGPSKRQVSFAAEEQIIADIEEFYDDPEGYVLYAFPWGEPGTVLEKHDGPDIWQCEQLRRIGAAFKEDPETTLREAIASGHGIGKTAEVAWIILWAMSTRPHLNGVVTANTTNQLSTKTWRELAYWHKLAINEHWFSWTATRFSHKEHPETWYVSAIPNTERNSEAFAGLHAEHVLMIFDEGSAIPDKIWEVAMGAMTTPRAMWFVYGNPTRNTGEFRECFKGRSAKMWTTRQIDSRNCKMTKKEELQEWVDAYGEDSDFVRVRIRGQFPRTSSLQFMPTDIVDMAMTREVPYEAFYSQPVILSCDVARFGDDKTVITLRQGRKVLHMAKFRELSTMDVARECALLIKQYRPQINFVDEVGVGAGVVDRLRQLGYDIVGVNAGARADDPEIYYNKRVEMWDRLRCWLRDGGELPNDPDLRASLIGVEFSYSDDKGTGERIRLERKRDMKRRGLESPDEGDSLAQTFAERIGPGVRGSFEPEDNFEPGGMG